MTSREFCYWLQGPPTDRPKALTAAQVATIGRHLAMVFVHEIDPSYPDGPALDATHAGKPKPAGGIVNPRC